MNTGEQSDAPAATPTMQGAGGPVSKQGVGRTNAIRPNAAAAAAAAAAARESLVSDDVPGGVLCERTELSSLPFCLAHLNADGAVCSLPQTLQRLHPCTPPPSPTTLSSPGPSDARSDDGTASDMQRGAGDGVGAEVDELLDGMTLRLRPPRPLSRPHVPPVCPPRPPLSRLSRPPTAPFYSPPP
jgi:hypothetical protein